VAGQDKERTGFFTPKFPQKYKGDPTKIVWRSTWERLAFKWVDENPDVVSWQSEEFFIPYRCKTDGKAHRYFPDLFIEYKSGAKVVVEIKPRSQVVKPVLTKGKRQKTFLMEAFTYHKNSSKWDAAGEYCRKNGYVFQIWTEYTLHSMGIKGIIKGKK